MEKHLDKELLVYYNQDIYAKTASSVLYDFSKEGSLKKIVDAKQKLLEKHPHNVVVKNTTNYFLHKLNPRDIKEHARKKHQKIIKKLNEKNKKVSQLASKKIKPGATVFVHSLNNQVYNTLLEAGKYKNFRVNILDHEPFSLGKTAKQRLKKEGIDIKNFPDISLHHALKEADLCLLGGEVILKHGAIVKHGSRTIAEQAKKDQIPTYVCAHTWKYDPEGKSHYLDHDHEYTDHDHRKVYELLSNNDFYAYVCEQGIFKPEHVVNEILFHNKWMLI